MQKRTLAALALPLGMAACLDAPLAPGRAPAAAEAPATLAVPADRLQALSALSWPPP
jgi:hypothetical protein